MSSATIVPTDRAHLPEPSTRIALASFGPPHISATILERAPELGTSARAGKPVQARGG